MKTCEFCGELNKEDANYCENCGAAFIEKAASKAGYISPISIIGFICAFIIPIVGLILGVIDVAQNDGRSKGLSIAAICISCFIIIVLVVAVLMPIYWMLDMTI